jgi:hypothetical protein
MRLERAKGFEPSTPTLARSRFPFAPPLSVPLYCYKTIVYSEIPTLNPDRTTLRLRRTAYIMLTFFGGPDNVSRSDRKEEGAMSGRLTKTAVEGLTPPGKQGEQSFLWDGELKGFGVRVIHSGLKTEVVPIHRTVWRPC